MTPDTLVNYNPNQNASVFSNIGARQMENLRITSRELGDRSLVYAVKFEATHGDATAHTVTIEANDKAAALRIHEVLAADAAYAETDVQ